MPKAVNYKLIIRILSKNIQLADYNRIKLVLDKITDIHFNLFSNKFGFLCSQ
jgi:hypothetical protein